VGFAVMAMVIPLLAVVNPLAESKNGLRAMASNPFRSYSPFSPKKVIRSFTRLL